MVKYTTLIVIVALIILAFLTLQFSKDSYKMLPLENSDPAKNDMENSNFQDWMEFNSPGGTFQVMLPKIPQQATENIKDPETGENRRYDMFISERLDGTIFMISLITFENVPNRQEAERLLEKMMDDMVNANPINNLESESFGDFRDNPSLDFTISNTDLNINAKTFMIGKTMYVLTRVAPSSVTDQNAFEFFVNSFELHEQ